MAVGVIITGAPASGKGTQCKLISQKYGLVHISSGDLLRKAVKDGTELGKNAKSFMDKGLLVPDDIVIGLIQKRMSADDVKRKGWILDGFPRTGAQAMALEKASIKPNAVLLLEVALDVLVKRTINRRLDPITDKIYHLEHDREILERDEELKKRLIARSDDTEEKCKLRFETFNENAESVLGCYKEICYPLDGAKHREETFEVISKIIDKLL